MIKKITTILLGLVLILTKSNGQSNTGTISGKVLIENKTEESITIELVHGVDSTKYKSTITDKSGKYTFSNIPSGKYQVAISAAGAIKSYSKLFDLKENEQRLIETISIKNNAKKLEEVSVISKKPFVENRIDKTVVNVEASPTSSGLNALEMLEKSPGVTVDNDGNISVKGKSGVIVLVDGKSTFLSGQDLTNYLKNLSANQLDQIEIMTQPSAKYDASGNSGIINFKTKKNRSAGLNGSVNATAIFAIYFKNTYSANFNYKKNKINLFGNIGYSNWIGFNDINIQRSFRTDLKTNSNRYYDQTTFGKFSSYPFSGKFGLDYNLSKKVTIGFTINGLETVQSFTSTGKNTIYDSIHNLAGYNNSLSQSRDPMKNFGSNVNFKYTSLKGSELSIDADYLKYQPRSIQFSNNYLYDSDNTLAEEPYLLKGNLPSIIDIKSLKFDYTTTFKNKLKLEAGIKSSWVKTDNDAQYTRYDSTQHAWFKDNTRSNHFIYDENINAGYVNFQKQFNKWGVQVGLRAEQTISKGHQDVNNSDFVKNYTKLFPTTYISYKSNEDNTFAFSYGRRIERPGYRDLNPFQYLLDRYTYQQGNPLLQPQFSNNMELSYNFKGILNVALNYTTTTGIINDILVSEKSGNNYITYDTKDNIASRKNMGLAISFNKPIRKWWTANIFFNVYNNQYKGLVDNEMIDVSYASFNANMSNQFSFKKGWSAEINGFLNYKNLVSSVILAQPMGMFSLGAGKQILKTKGTIKLNVRDPFYIMKFEGYTAMDKYTSNVYSKWDNRRVIIAFTYRFGKTAGQQQRRRSSSEDEQSRVGGGSNNN